MRVSSPVEARTSFIASAVSLPLAVLARPLLSGFSEQLYELDLAPGLFFSQTGS